MLANFFHLKVFVQGILPPCLSETHKVEGICQLKQTKTGEQFFILKNSCSEGFDGNPKPARNNGIRDLSTNIQVI